MRIVIKDFMDKEVHLRPRTDNFGWVSKVAEIDDFIAVVLYGAMMLGHGMGNVMVGPELNGIAVIAGGLLLRDDIVREASGYFGPSNKQLFAFEAITKMEQEQFYKWVNDGCQDMVWTQPKLCPKCNTPLECDVSYVFKGMPLLEDYRGGLEWDEDQANSRDAVDFDYIFCPQCDEEVKLEAED